MFIQAIHFARRNSEKLGMGSYPGHSRRHLGFIFAVTMVVGLTVGRHLQESSIDESSSLAATTPDPEIAPMGYSIINDLRHCNPLYDINHALNKTWLMAAAKRLQIRKAHGLDVSCPQQIWQEIFWMNRSTAWFKTVRGRKVAFEKALTDNTVPEPANDINPYNACSDSTIQQLSTDFDQMADAYHRDKPLTVLPRFFESVGTPEELHSFMQNLVVSDVYHKCIDHRDELNEWTSDLTRLIFRKMVHTPSFDPDLLNQTLIHFIEDDWQNQGSGYWGAWYLHNGTLIKTDDLSLTFHIVSYYPKKRNVKLWSKIVDTTLANKKGRYPYGWEGPLQRKCPHHMYDVVRLFHYGWPYMDEGQRGRVRTEIQAIADWARAEVKKPSWVSNKLCDPGDTDTAEFTQKLVEELAARDDGEASSGKPYFWAP